MDHMDQNATSNTEGSLDPVSETLAAQSQEALTTTGVETNLPTPEANDVFSTLDVFGGLTDVQLPVSYTHLTLPTIYSV